MWCCDHLIRHCLIGFAQRHEKHPLERDETMAKRTFGTRIFVVMMVEMLAQVVLAMYLEARRVFHIPYSHVVCWNAGWGCSLKD